MKTPNRDIGRKCFINRHEMDPQFFQLTTPHSRQSARAALLAAPDGSVVIVRPPRRTSDQNAMLWTMLQAFAEQLHWPVNGQMCRLAPGEWKDILTAAFRRESARIAMGIDGGVVMLGLHTSRMHKHEFSDLIEFIRSVAVERGVVIEDDAVLRGEPLAASPLENTVIHGG